MDKIDNILLDQEMVSILGQCGPALIDALQGKFGCTAVLHGVEASSAGNSKKPAPEIRYTTQLSKGLCVSVWKDDLTTHKAEVVVNAANCDLQHCGGLAKALSDAGGPEIQQESNKFLKNNRPLLTGEAIIANAGRLPCSKIIHAVGPNLPTNPNKYMVKQAIPLLQKTIGSILSIVSGENLKSVAIPAISSGLFNFPLPLCAEIIVKTLKEYNDIYYSGAPLEVRLVNHDDPSVMAMERACKDILGQSNMAHRQLPSYSRTKMTPLSTASFSNAVIHGTGSTPTSLKINNFSLCVKKGNIEEEQTSIIVNTISQDLELSKGAISKAICEKAGRGIQDELKNNRLAKYGDVIKTKGYRLACSAVYHTICSYKNEYQSNEVLAEIVYKCLSLAKESQMLSISFPAIGTGALGFNKHDVAQIMMDTAVEFEKNNSGTYMNICYVIFPSDNDTYMAFTNKFKSLMGAKPNPFKSVSFQGYEPKDDPYASRHAWTSTQPYIELHCAFDERLREAKRWYTGIFSPDMNVFTIRNNFIQHFGQKEMEELLIIQRKWKVSFKVFFNDGFASINIHGAFTDVRAAALEVEALCCKVQYDFANEEERFMGLKTQISSPRKPLEENTADYMEIKKHFSRFQIVRVEKIENGALRDLFNLKKKQMQVFTSQQMYQCLPSYFCDLLSRVGFQREFAPPDEQKLGKGIYFSGSADGADKLWRGLANEEYLYFIKAQVLTGKSTAGSPGLIVPPERNSGEPFSLFDSVEGGVETHVIFNGWQALPEYLITCKNQTNVV